MRLAHKIAAALLILHALAYAAVLFLPWYGPTADFAGLTVYLPLFIFNWLGLPVFQSSGSWGWSSPSGLGIVMVIIFWLGVWLCLGYLVERLIKR